MKDNNDKTKSNSYVRDDDIKIITNNNKELKQRKITLTNNPHRVQRYKPRLQMAIKVGLRL